MATTEEARPGLVLPEYGPTAPELIRGRLGPRGRAALAVAAIVLLVAILLLVISGGDGLTKLEHRAEPRFTMLYAPAEIDRVKPQAGELERLEARRNGLRIDVTVRPLALPPYEGSVSGLLPISADRHAAELARELPGFRYQRDGKARVNDAPGYQLRYRAGRMTGTDLMIVPEDGDREGVILRLRQTNPRRVLGEHQKELSKAARKAFRSFRFGLERP
jgi:hypothetical protein